MMRLVNVANVLLIITSWLFALLGMYASLITGLNPTLVIIVLLFWTVLTWRIYRFASFTTRQARWRKVIPALFFLLSITCFKYTFAFFQQEYSNEHGFPRRYYSSDTER